MAGASGDWVFADGWVFAAIALNGRRCSLHDVVGAADLINHAIVLDHEVEVALGKLTGAGLVRIFDDWTFELTDEGESKWPDIGRDLQTRLEAVVVSLAAVEPGQTRVVLPPGALDQAIRAYLKHAQG